MNPLGRTQSPADPSAIARTKAVLAGKRIGQALAEITAARALLGELRDDPGTGVGDDRWEWLFAMLRAAGQPSAGAEYHELRRACAALACRCSIDGPGEVIPPACPVHGIPCDDCGGVEECAPGCGEAVQEPRKPHGRGCYCPDCEAERGEEALEAAEVTADRRAYFDIDGPDGEGSDLD